MQKLEGQVHFSATDLTHFAECAYRTWLDRLDLEDPQEKTEDDEHAKLIHAKGVAHEVAFLDRLRSSGRTVIEIASEAGLQARIERTRAAVREGADVVYQATLRRGNLLGHADFLIRVGEVKPMGGSAYEVIDTKLARSAKAKFVLQLCFYSDLLTDLTGKRPGHILLELGDGARETLRLADYFYYYRRLLERFLKFVDRQVAAEPGYPVPCDFCLLCHWRDRCKARREADDHLSIVAGITAQQISRLQSAGVDTVARLAALAPDSPVARMAAPTLSRLREQAALQVEERQTGRQNAIVLPHDHGETRGFALLPKPDRGDLFFDMEGDPLEDGGLEYLFGVAYFEGEELQFKCFWAHNREDERRAFVDFIDFVMDRRARFPGMHIYHYAAYEKAALRRLMMLHGVCESAVDQLLREERMVDLYKVVRQGLRLSKPNYSIKSVESFYSAKREGEVTTAADSIVVYERWRESRDPALLEAIRAYNEADCRSTWQLRDWLLSMRPVGLCWFSAIASEESPPLKPARPKSDKTIKHEQALQTFHKLLIAQPANPSIPPDLAETVYYLLDFHRRCDKPVWWALFDRQAMDFDELLEDPEVIAGLHDPAWIPGGDESRVRYRYPEQEFKARAGDRGKRLDTLRDVSIVAIDEDALTIDLELRLDAPAEPPPSLSVSIGAPVPTDSIRAALFAFADNLVEGTPKYKALHDFLLHRLPSVRGVEAGAPIIASGEESLPKIVAAVRNLDDSYLFIQGPPGSGKTFTGSHVIAALLQAGKRIAVSSNSHKAINNLLEAVDKRMKEAGASYVGMKKSSSVDQFANSEFVLDVRSDEPIIRQRPQLVAGTAWLFSKSAFWSDFDYLVIDEAGQVSVANTIAMGMCARNVILLGDQMQLGQPIQGVHPGRSGESALEYLLDGEATVPCERGIFLDKTYRMHPNVCRFISDAIYDSRLEADPSTWSQALILDKRAHPALKSTGISFFPVEHEGCSQRSEEEAAVVRAIVDSLLAQRYRDKKGEVKPITLQDILVVAPYNMQVNLLKKALPRGARVGTVDKFQGQEAEVVIVSMATSSSADLPRHIGFLFSRNRLNVAVSRARSLAIFLSSEQLLDVEARTPLEMSLINTLNMLHTYSTRQGANQ